MRSVPLIVALVLSATALAADDRPAPGVSAAVTDTTGAGRYH